MILTAVSALFLLAAAQVDRDIVYATPSGTKQLLDIYRPAKPQGLLPVVVWIHGGAFRTGSKDQAGSVTWLTEHGYAVVSINYRLSQEAIYPAQIQDCQAAVAWLRAHATDYGFDPARFGAWGPSAGGHLVSMVGLTAGPNDPSRVRAVVDFFGPTDFLQMDAHALPKGMKHDPVDSPESQLVGGAIQDNKDKVARANPVTYVTAQAPPFLILHGDQDPLVPVHQSELLHAALKQASVPVTFHKIIGAGHGGPQFDTPVVRAMVLAFFDQHLKAR